MQELKNTLENTIMKRLAIETAISEVKLMESIGITNNPDNIDTYNKSLTSLYYKGLIDIIKDKYNMGSIIRIKVDYQ